MDSLSSLKVKPSPPQYKWVSHPLIFLINNDKIGFLIDVGTRDETHDTSGACLAIKNTYLKTLKHTNETINYGMIQMSGGNMEMSYD
jgi:hypothetical protein